LSVLEGDHARQCLEIGVKDSAGVLAKSGASLWYLDVEAAPGDEPKVLSVKLDLGFSGTPR
jgi:hypothetical protein